MQRVIDSLIHSNALPEADRQRVTDALAQGKPLDDAKVKTVISGANARLNGNGRLVIRPSGTEPVIRVMGEGDDQVLVEEIVDEIVDALNQAAA